MAEIRRLLHAWGEPAWRRALRLHWSQFRRRHQASAAKAHVVRRARQHPLPSAVVAKPLSLLGVEELTPERWERLRPLLPPQAPTGRPAGDHRRIVEGILWVIRTGSLWRTLPERFGPWHTVESRYRRWCKDGRWARMLQFLQRPDIPITSSA